MHFAALIPVRNGGAKLERTIHSILNQTSVRSGQDLVKCVVLDGASTDDTVAVARRNGVEVRTEPDTGMYDALAKGLPLVDGDVVSYLSAGEVYDVEAFGIVSELLRKFPQIGWLTGRAVARNSRCQIIDSRLPHPFRRRFFECGEYGTRLPALQQESTFWRASLNHAIDLATLRSARLAGDYFLWKCLATVAELYVVNAQLGSFTHESGQLSKQDPAAYAAEVRRLRRPPSLAEELSAAWINRWTRSRIPHRRSARLVRYNIRVEQWQILGAGGSHAG